MEELFHASDNPVQIKVVVIIWLWVLWSAKKRELLKYYNVRYCLNGMSRFSVSHVCFPFTWNDLQIQKFNEGSGFAEVMVSNSNWELVKDAEHRCHFLLYVLCGWERIKQLSVVDLFCLELWYYNRPDVLILMSVHNTEWSMYYCVVLKGHQNILEFPMLKE